MSTVGPKNALPGADQVSRAYQAADFDEEPPAELDRAILATARRQHRRPLASYLPPLALAATVILSISLVLRSGVLNENSEIFSDEAPAPPAARTAPVATPIELDEIVAPEEAADNGTIVQSERLLAPQFEAVELRSRAAELPRATAAAASAVLADCTGAVREQPDTWLACIAVSLQQGNEDDARREVEAFAQAYPDYSLPKDLEALLAP